MKILIITRGFPSEKDPFLGNFEATQAFALQRAGHQVIYLGVGYLPPNPKYFLMIFRLLTLKSFVRNGLIVYNKFFLSFPGRWSRKLSGLIIFNQVDKIYKKIEKTHGKPDIIHSHYLYISYYSSILKNKYNLPFICTEHWSQLQSANLPAGIQFMGEKTYPLADRVIAVSSSLQAKLNLNFGQNSIVVHNMVDNAFFDGKSVIHRNDGKFKFVSVGHLIERKGHDILLKAFAKADFEDNVTLSIIGDGVEKLTLQKLIDQLKLTDRVSLVGFKNMQEINQLLMESDAFVLASRKETFGVVYIEALAKGLPVIATICGGPEEFVNENNGLLVPVEDVDKLCEALRTMYLNRNKYNSEAIIEQCKENFSENVIVKKITSVYREVLNKIEK